MELKDAPERQPNKDHQCDGKEQGNYAQGKVRQDRRRCREKREKASEGDCCDRGCGSIGLVDEQIDHALRGLEDVERSAMVLFVVHPVLA